MNSITRPATTPRLDLTTRRTMRPLAAARSHRWEAMQPLEPRALLAADLAFRDPALSYAAATLQPGQDFIVTTGMRNIGDAATGAFDIAFFLSTNDTIGDADDVLIGTVRRTNPVGAGGIATEFPSLTLPANLPDGAYRLVALLDAANEVVENTDANNSAINTGTLITVDGPGPNPTGNPEIVLTGRGQDIQNGANPRRGDHTDFGRARVNGAFIDRTFTISNSGDADLNISDIRVLGNAAARGALFILSEPTDTVLSPNETATVTVRFDPNARGTRNARLEIVSNDSDEATFSIRIKGQGQSGNAARQPQTAVVSPNNRVITDGDTTPGDRDRTRFGRVTVGQTKDRTYTIRNDGDGRLGVNPDADLNFVRISGDDADQFTIVTDPTAVVAAGQTTPFTIRFNPTSTGLKTALIEIVCTDGTYTFAINGNGRAG